MSESAPMTEESDMAETSSIPASLVDGTPSPGDTITLTVVDVDQENGSITVAKAGEAETEPQGSDALASEFEPT